MQNPNAIPTQFSGQPVYANQTIPVQTSQNLGLNQSIPLQTSGLGLNQSVPLQTSQNVSLNSVPLQSSSGFVVSRTVPLQSSTLTAEQVFPSQPGQVAMNFGLHNPINNTDLTNQTNKEGLKEAGADLVVPGVEIAGEGLDGGVRMMTGGFAKGLGSIRTGLTHGAETIASGFGQRSSNNVFVQEHPHQNHGIGTGLAEVGSGIGGTAVSLAGSGINAGLQVGGAAIGTGLALGGTGIGIGADLIGNVAGTLTNGARKIGHGFADIAHGLGHRHKKQH